MNYYTEMPIRPITNKKTIKLVHFDSSSDMSKEPTM